MSVAYQQAQKQQCLYNNLNEEQFNNTWETLKGMVGLMKTDYELEDLSYEECRVAHGGGAVNTNEPEGCDSY